MNPVLVTIAVKHLLARRRQSVVSLLGIVFGVAFFLAIASLMQGSESDFIKRLVDNSPHITISADYRSAQKQPVEEAFKDGAVVIRSLTPETETRGIRGHERIMELIRAIPDLRASPVLTGDALVSFAGRNVGLVLNGMIPEEVRDVSTIQNYMIDGSVDALTANPDGIIVGTELVRKLSLGMNKNITLSTPGGQVHTFKVVGIFRTGRINYDESQAFVNLKRAQALFDRPNRVNTIIVKLDDPYQARAVATQIENAIGYKSVSWQEATEDLMSTLTIRNIIMYTVVSAVLVVAAFGIYNVISTVVLEKRRDIAILKSMGFRAGDIQRVFLMEGFLLGLGGSIFGLILGAIFMYGLGRIALRYPGASEPIQMPMDWSALQFIIAAAFAMAAALLAAFLPARRGASVHPAEILRGS
jgi:lipoprotein-releasing system permease protein